MHALSAAPRGSNALGMVKSTAPGQRQRCSLRCRPGRWRKVILEAFAPPLAAVRPHRSHRARRRLEGRRKWFCGASGRACDAKDKGESITSVDGGRCGRAGRMHARYLEQVVGGRTALWVACPSPVEVDRSPLPACTGTTICICICLLRVGSSVADTDDFNRGPLPPLIAAFEIAVSGIGRAALPASKQRR